MANRTMKPRAILGIADPKRRARLVRAMRDDGWTVYSATHGLDMVRALADDILDEDVILGPDLIIADVAMVGCSALSILGGLRDLHFPTPIFVVADFNRPDLMEAAMALGATSVFEKPLDIEAVRAAAAAMRPVTPMRRRARRRGVPRPVPQSSW